MSVDYGNVNYRRQKTLMKEAKVSRDAVSKLLDEYEAQENIKLKRCKISNEHIIWHDTGVKHPQSSMKLALRGKTAMSTKTVNCTVYCLSVSEASFNEYFDYALDGKNRAKFFNTCNQFSKFAYSISDEDFIAACKSTAVTLENMVSRYGDEEGEKRFDSYREKQSAKNTFEYKQKHFGWTQEEFDEFNYSRSSTMENFVRRYGDEEGEKRFKLYNERQAMTNFGAVSKVSLKMIDEILEKFPELIKNYYNSNEFGRMHNELKSYFKYDFVNTNYNIAIEFHGDVFHANPKFWSSDSKPSPYHRDRTAEEIWQKDKDKAELLIKSGFHYFVIWEYDYNVNHTETMQSLFNNINTIIQDKNAKRAIT